eukprot:364453-Chlamydomonas_euryale.AAC.18
MPEFPSMWNTAPRGRGAGRSPAGRREPGAPTTRHRPRRPCCRRNTRDREREVGGKARNDGRVATPSV